MLKSRRNCGQIVPADCGCCGSGIVFGPGCSEEDTNEAVWLWTWKQLGGVNCFCVVCNGRLCGASFIVEEDSCSRWIFSQFEIDFEVNPLNNRPRNSCWNEKPKKRIFTPIWH